MSLRSIVVAAFRALASMPRMIFETCRETGRIVARVLSPSVSAVGPNLVSDVGAAAEDAVEQLAPARTKNVPSPTATVQGWCHSRLVPGKATPDISHLPLATQAWLGSLTDEEIRTLYKKPAHVVSAHIEGMYWISGVPPVTPMKTIQDRPGLDREAIARQAWTNVIDEIQATPMRYVGA